jgi:hypothetical protein
MTKARLCESPVIPFVGTSSKTLSKRFLIDKAWAEVVDKIEIAKYPDFSERRPACHGRQPTLDWSVTLAVTAIRPRH